MLTAYSKQFDWQFDGALLAARYAYMPNRLNYCGGDNNSQLFAYASQQESDAGLREMLEEFATMYPYLRLIAEANQILDPFDYRVVEAYWLGNELLNKVSMKDFYRHLIDKQKIKKQLKPELAEKVFGKLTLGAKPHHSWHVLGIPKRTGNYPVAHTIKTMDECRIAWGRVKNEVKTLKDLSEKIIVEYQPLKIMSNELVLGGLEDREVWLASNDKSFVPNLAVGDYVSIHWGWVCDLLTDRQKNNLEKWTKYNLKLFSV